MAEPLRFEAVVAGVGQALAAYTQALDDGRTDDVVATFCPDGTAEFPGLATFTGHDDLRAGYAGWAPQAPQRHLVLNTLVTRWDEHEAHASSDVVLLVKGGDRWTVALAGRYHDVLHRHDDGWRFHHRRADFIS